MAIDSSAAVATSFKFGTHEVQGTTHFDIASPPQHGAYADVVPGNVNLSSRHGAGGNYDFRCPCQLETSAGTRNNLDRELRRALERGEFVLHYQLQLDVATRRCASVEALVRWNHPDRGLVMPGDFIPAAEASGLIGPLGAWVMQEACRQAKLWQQLGWPLAVAVNVSPAQLDHDALLLMVGDALGESGLDPAALEIEITEGVMIKSIDQTGDKLLRGLVDQGVRLAIDDFGTGYSSLAYLKHLPVGTIKIDRSFLPDLGSVPPDKELLQWMVMLGQALGKRVVAEGVENHLQLALLGEIGCDVVQGFHIARPLAADQLERLLSSKGYSCETYSRSASPRRASPASRDLSKYHRATTRPPGSAIPPQPVGQETITL